MKFEKVTPIVRVVDDDKNLLFALKQLLELEGWQVETYISGADFLSCDRPSIPGCIVLDISMPGMNGLEIHDTLVQHGIQTPILFLTGHGDIDTAVSSLKKGAVDFIQKPFDKGRLLSAIAEAVENDLHTRGIVSDLKLVVPAFQQLTPREEQIVRLAAKGMLNRAIGERLSLSKRTVETHRANAIKKLGTNSIAEWSRLIYINDKAERRNE